MFHYNEPVQDRQGNGLVGYFIGVVTPDPANPQGGSEATIYADANGTPIVSVSGVDNRAKVDENGMVSFYVTEGSYHIDLYGPDGTTNLNRYYNIPMLSAAVNTTAASSVGSRALMAAIASPVSTQSVYLSEAGREGTFVFDSSNNATNVTNDPQQGIYVAPSSDTTGASGAWVRKYSDQLALEWFGGGTGVADNKTAFDAIKTLFPTGFHLKLRVGTYAFSQMSLVNSTILTGFGLDISLIKITGDGGGLTGPNGGGGMLLNNITGCNISDLGIVYNNPSLLCILNITGGGRHTVRTVDMNQAGLSMAQQGALGVYMSSQTHTEFDRVYIAGCAQDMIANGNNGCALRNVNFRPHSLDIANSVFNTALPQLDLNNGSSWAFEVDNCIFEQGPNGIKITGQGAVDVNCCYFSDGNVGKGMWQPGMAVAQGDTIFAAATITGSITSGTATLTVSDATNLYSGQKIIVAGAGAAGANLSTRISSISGTTVTLAANAGTTVTNAVVCYPAYRGHIYIATTAGTTGTSLPALPTTAGATVTDGTVTWREYGTGAYIDLGTSGGLVGKNSTVISGSFIGTGPIGISAITSGNHPGALNVIGCTFQNPQYLGYFDGVSSLTLKGNQLNAYQTTGFEITATSGTAYVNEITANQPTANGADFVVSANVTGGRVSSSVGLTGISAPKFHQYRGDTGALVVPGSIAIGSGTPITGMVVYTPSLTPASVAAQTVAEQTFTVTGLTTADKVIVNPPANATATGVCGARVSAANTLAIRFNNPTAGALTPASGAYTVVAFRS